MIQKIILLVPFLIYSQAFAGGTVCIQEANQSMLNSETFATEVEGPVIVIIEGFEKVEKVNPRLGMVSLEGTNNNGAITITRVIGDEIVPYKAKDVWSDPKGDGIRHRFLFWNEYSSTFVKSRLDYHEGVDAGSNTAIWVDQDSDIEHYSLCVPFEN